MSEAFWKLNREGDMAGHFPVKALQARAMSEAEIEVSIFNDDLCGSELELIWEAREGSPSNWLMDSGRVELLIEPGNSKEAVLMVKMPKFNTCVFVKLRIIKNAVIRYEDDFTCIECIEGEDFKSEFNGKERIFK